MKTALLLALALLSGCAERPHSYVRGTTSSAEFTRAEADCRAQRLAIPNQNLGSEFMDSCMLARGFQREH